VTLDVDSLHLLQDLGLLSLRHPTEPHRYSIRTHTCTHAREGNRRLAKCHRYWQLEAIQRWSAICRVWPWTIKNSFYAFLAWVKAYTHMPKIKHAHLLVLIWERLQTTTTTTTTTPDTRVQPLGRHIDIKNL